MSTGKQARDPATPIELAVTGEPHVDHGEVGKHTTAVDISHDTLTAIFVKCKPQIKHTLIKVL
jgi:hypothetical protein